MDGSGGAGYENNVRHVLSTAAALPLANTTHPADWYEIQSLSRTPHGATGGHKPPKSNWRKFKDAIRIALVWIFSNVGICVLVNAYLLLGALVFQSIEGGPTEIISDF